MKGSSNFRLSITHDLAEVFPIFRTIFMSDDPAELEDPRTVVWLLRAGRHRAGFCSARPVKGDPTTLFFNWAGVMPAFRGHGLQKKMIKTRLKWAKMHGFCTAITYCTTDNYRSANNLWSCGFRLYWPEYAWVGKNVLYFKKDLGERP